VDTAVEYPELLTQLIRRGTTYGESQSQVQEAFNSQKRIKNLDLFLVRKPQQNDLVAYESIAAETRKNGAV
jgi:hypothetical protein